MIQGISKRFNNFSSRNFSINEERIVLTSLVQTLSVAVVSQSFEGNYRTDIFFKKNRLQFLYVNLPVINFGTFGLYEYSS